MNEAIEVLADQVEEENMVSKYFDLDEQKVLCFHDSKGLVTGKNSQMRFGVINAKCQLSPS